MSGPPVADIEDLHECSHVIEIIKRVEETRYNMRLGVHVLSFNSSPL